VVAFTVVAFHAHPDDEALLTGGTLAGAAAEGHRVVLVTATAGEAGLTDPARTGDLGRRRREELDRAALALGCARVVVLGYPDSGSGPAPPAAGSFASLDPAGPARRLAAILREEGADVLMSYDEHGGYGHPDHVQVHRVGRLAHALAGTPVLLEASVDRDRLQRVAGWLSLLPRLSGLVPDDRFASSYLPAAALTHAVDVRPHLTAKRAALQAHRSQARGGQVRTIRLLLGLPAPLVATVLGTEWFHEPGRRPGPPLCGDPFASLR
jgi:LmbE family N-acetylglucosaminyl deacetylase